MSRWLTSWSVTSSTGVHKYKVSYGQDGSWGCSCPIWKYKRNECKHIKEIISQVGRHPSVLDSPYQKPMYVLSDEVNVPIFDERTNELRIPRGYPNRRSDQDWLETHICFAMLNNGFSIREIRSIRGLDATWTTKKVERDFKSMGDFQPDGWYPSKSEGTSRKKPTSKIRELMIIK